MEKFTFTQKNNVVVVKITRSPYLGDAKMFYFSGVVQMNGKQAKLSSGSSSDMFDSFLLDMLRSVAKILGCNLEELTIEYTKDSKEHRIELRTKNNKYSGLYYSTGEYFGVRDGTF